MSLFDPPKGSRFDQGPTTSSWLVGIAWLIIVVLALIGLVAVAIHFIG